ncbi:MAG: tRNA uridine-5-carboxymethylaminomethyl(34) synthesis GTPase MnmE [Oscillibacter sp.]|jgi:tRNA modification GTPase|nr:tRNA uridine-5-carboxymethylaminomethyl(34) synthesis GTPase MnmE [Oscillibacter sp.]
MDLIAAIATGSAATAIGIVRVSGDGCFSLCGRLFSAADKRALSDHAPRTLIYGDILCADGALLDRGLAALFPAPHSYTGEDSVEFDCHGSPVALRELLSALFSLGVRQAKPGEFTKRAFLNGRMDLTEAEAVIDLIDAETPAAAKNAAAQLTGALRRKLSPVQDALLNVTSRFYAVVDYPDEDIEDVHPADIAAALDTSERTLSALLATSQRGKILKSGVRTAIVGRPNAGKSSLLNALAGFERAIVTDIPGTTRDTVEESAFCGGVHLRLIDTAGLRETADTVEALGVERAKAALQSADLVLAVIDGAEAALHGLSEEDRSVLEQVSRCPKWLLIFSKADLAGGADICPQVRFSGTDAVAPAAILSLSSVTGAGLDALEQSVCALFPVSQQDAGALLTDTRQEDAVRRALSAIRRAKDAMAGGLTPDAILTDAEEALDALGELTGRTAREDLVARIFSRFCVGK